MNGTELNKLVVLLARADIPFEIRNMAVCGSTWQVCSPNYDTCKIDAVSHDYSYGGSAGLIEIMAEGLEDVVGWLTAEQAFDYFKQIVG